MSKASGEADEPDVSTEQVEDSQENQPLRTLSHDDAYLEDVEDFATQHGFEPELEMLQKAAHLLCANADENDIPGVTPAELDALHLESTHKWRQPWTLYFTVFVCSLGAIEQGWAQTGMNGANLYLPKAMKIDSDSPHDSFILGLLNCGLYLANACWGSWISEPVNRRIGRRGAIAVANAFCLVGNLGSGISDSWPILLLFRLVLGTGLGLNASTVSILAAESAPPYIRGGLATSWQMFTAFGIFVGFLANVAFYHLGPEVIWRYQLAAPAVPTVPLLLLVYLCPESPAWHFTRGHYRKGFDSLVKLRNTKLQATREMYSVYLARKHDIHLRTTARQSFGSKFGSLFTVPRSRHAMYASYTVMLAQQICGINIIAFFSSTIFSSSDFSAQADLWASVVFGFVNFVGAFPAIWTMDTFGRRRLLLWTLPPMALVMALAGLSFTLPKGTAQFVILAGLIYLFCALYSPGMGPVPVAYSAEVYPVHVREVGMSFAISTASTWATILSLTFPALLNGIGEVSTFELYAALNVVAWFLCWAFVREVKGVKLEEMDAVFESSAGTFVRECWADSLWKRISRAGAGKGWVKVGQDDLDDR